MGRRCDVKQKDARRGAPAGIEPCSTRTCSPSCVASTGTTVVNVLLYSSTGREQCPTDLPLCLLQDSMPGVKRAVIRGLCEDTMNQ